DIVPILRVLPDKESAPGQPTHPDDPPLDLHVLHVEQLVRRELRQDVHAELRHEKVAGLDGHMPHPRPHGHQPRLVHFQLVRHLFIPRSFAPNGSRSWPRDRTHTRVVSPDRLADGPSTPSHPSERIRNWVVASHAPYEPRPSYPSSPARLDQTK